MASRIMYIECKAGELEGPARIGRVTFSRTMRSVHYRGRRLERLNPRGYKANFVDVESSERYWISGCKKRGGDTLYGGVIEIDDDVREEYWTTIRGMPECKNQGTIRCTGKY